MAHFFLFIFLLGVAIVAIGVWWSQFASESTKAAIEAAVSPAFEAVVGVVGAAILWFRQKFGGAGIVFWIAILLLKGCLVRKSSFVVNVKHQQATCLPAGLSVSSVGPYAGGGALAWNCPAPASEPLRPCDVLCSPWTGFCLITGGPRYEYEAQEAYFQPLAGEGPLDDDFDAADHRSAPVFGGSGYR